MARTVKSQNRTIDLKAGRSLTKKADPELLTEQHRRFRKIVCERADWQCQWVENGQRCIKSRDRGFTMIADHIVERKDGGDPFDPDNGQCLCVAHNTLKGIRAREARMQQRF